MTAGVAKAEGKKDEAIKIMSKAAEMEDKSASTRSAPARSTRSASKLGELLPRSCERPADALAAFQASLALAHRFTESRRRRAAHLAKKDDEARKYYSQLVAVAGNGDAQGAELAQAKEFLAGKGKAQ